MKCEKNYYCFSRPTANGMKTFMRSYEQGEGSDGKRTRTKTLGGGGGGRVEVYKIAKFERTYCMGYHLIKISLKLTC